jgi:hypothetical protein
MLLQSTTCLKQASEEVSHSTSPPLEEIDDDQLLVLATELLEDPKDRESLQQLTLQEPDLSELQSDFFDLLSNAVDEDFLANLSDCGRERLAYLLHHAPVSDEAIAFALDTLEYSAALESSRDGYEGLVLAAFELLRRATPELCTERDDVLDFVVVERLVRLALKYGENLEPCGAYQENGQIAFDFNDQPLAHSDLVGAGAILLLCKVDSSTLYATLAKLDDENARPVVQVTAAVRFSKQHPSAPNLLLNLLGAHRDYFRKDLHRLHDIQSGVLRGGEHRRVLMRSFKQGAHAGMLLASAASPFLRLLLGPGNIDPTVAAAGFLCASAATGFLNWRYQIHRIKERNKISPQHQQDLKSIVETIKGDFGKNRE